MGILLGEPEGDIFDFTTLTSDELTLVRTQGEPLASIPDCASLDTVTVTNRSHNATQPLNSTLLGDRDGYCEPEVPRNCPLEEDFIDKENISPESSPLPLSITPIKRKLLTICEEIDNIHDTNKRDKLINIVNLVGNCTKQIAHEFII